MTLYGDFVRMNLRNELDSAKIPEALGPGYPMPSCGASRDDDRALVDVRKSPETT